MFLNSVIYQVSDRNTIDQECFLLWSAPYAKRRVAQISFNYTLGNFNADSNCYTVAILARVSWPS